MRCIDGWSQSLQFSASMISADCLATSNAADNVEALLLLAGLDNVGGDEAEGSVVEMEDASGEVNPMVKSIAEMC